MKICLRKNAMGWKITFLGSVRYARNDENIRFAQKYQKLKKSDFNQKKKLYRRSLFDGWDYAPRSKREDVDCVFCVAGG